MKDYVTGKWGVAFIFSLSGSVVPKALAWAIPSATMATIIHFCIHLNEQAGSIIGDAIGDNLNTSQVWTGYNFLIAFLLTFRTGIAYNRWWEGGTLLRQARGEWFNAYSSLIAFSSTTTEKKEEVKQFQSLLATLMSNLFCASLNTISQMEEPFEVLNLAPISAEGLKFVSESTDKVELFTVWIQKLIVESMNSGLLPIPPPVISRVFQELSRGMVNLNEVRKISEYLFPFPYAQLITAMLLLHTVMTPIVTGVLLEKWYWAFTITVLSVFAFWSLNYVAVEIECPFGDDTNDLPLMRMQRVLNRTLLLLLSDEAQKVPRGDEKHFETLRRNRTSIVTDFIGPRSPSKKMTGTGTFEVVSQPLVEEGVETEDDIAEEVPDDAIKLGASFCEDESVVSGDCLVKDDLLQAQDQQQATNPQFIATGMWEPFTKTTSTDADEAEPLPTSPKSAGDGLQRSFSKDREEWKPLAAPVVAAPKQGICENQIVREPGALPAAGLGAGINSNPQQLGSPAQTRGSGKHDGPKGAAASGEG